MEESDDIFTLLLKQHWGKSITEEEIAVLNEYKERSPYHKELIENFGNAGWINNNLAHLDSFPKEVLRQRIKSVINTSGSGNADKNTEKVFSPYTDSAEHFAHATVSADKIKVHKNWKDVFLVMFILFKILLIYAIYITYKYYKCKHSSF